MHRSLLVICMIAILLAMACDTGVAQLTLLIRVTASCQVVPEGYQYRIAVRNDTDPADGYYVGTLRLGVYYPSGQYPNPFGLVSPPDSWLGRISNCGAVDPVEWEVLYDYRGGIAPGASLSSFGFTSAVLPSRITFEADGWDGLVGIWNTGDLPVEMIPEPSSLLALGVGLLGLAHAFRRRRR